MAVAGRGNADTVTDLSWKDLLPVGDPSLPADLQGILPHDEAGMAARQPLSSGIRTDWNGQAVRLSGFIVPIDYKGTGVTAFILVPYVEACVHVPPPPANQLVFVTAENPLRKRWPVRSCDRCRNVRHGIGIDPIGRNWVCAICGRPRILSKITTGTARAVSPRYVLIQGACPVGPCGRIAPAPGFAGAGKGLVRVSPRSGCVSCRSPDQSPPGRRWVDRNAPGHRTAAQRRSDPSYSHRP